MVSTDLEDKEYIEWLFQVPKQTNCNELKEKTLLQRKVKKLVLQGNHIGSGFGVLK